MYNFHIPFYINSCHYLLCPSIPTQLSFKRINRVFWILRSLSYLAAKQIRRIIQCKLKSLKRVDILFCLGYLVQHVELLFLWIKQEIVVGKIFHCMKKLDFDYIGFYALICCKKIILSSKLRKRSQMWRVRLRLNRKGESIDNSKWKTNSQKRSTITPSASMFCQLLQDDFVLSFEWIIDGIFLLWVNFWHLCW